MKLADSLYPPCQPVFPKRTFSAWRIARVYTERSVQFLLSKTGLFVGEAVRIVSGIYSRRPIPTLTFVF